MADVQVFVDDAVRGTLPGVCAKDGVPTVDQLRFTTDIGNPAGLGVAWLLVLAGPLGWLGLIVISFLRSSRPEQLTVQLPLSAPAYQRITARRRQRSIATGVAFVSVLLELWALISYDDSGGAALLWRSLGIAVAVAFVASIVGMVISDRRITQATVGLDLDASRRWVTLHRVHPAFADACRSQEQQRAQQRT